MSISKILLRTAVAVVSLFPLALSAEEPAPQGGGRAMIVTVEAVVTDIDLENRQVSLQGPMGQPVTITATEQVVKLEDVSVGDTLIATYMASLEGELRAPTEEELAEPWVVLEDAGVLEGADQPTAGGARLIRAVCTVTVMDPRGKAHVIADVEPEKMEGVTLGQTIVMVYTEAIAVTLEHVKE